MGRADVQASPLNPTRSGQTPACWRAEKIAGLVYFLISSDLPGLVLAAGTFSESTFI
jgi:hypothetical protein